MHIRRGCTHSRHPLSERLSENPKPVKRKRQLNSTNSLREFVLKLGASFPVVIDYRVGWHPPPGRPGKLTAFYPPRLQEAGRSSRCWFWTDWVCASRIQLRPHQEQQGQDCHAPLRNGGNGRRGAIVIIGAGAAARAAAVAVDARRDHLVRRAVRARAVAGLRRVARARRGAAFERARLEGIGWAVARAVAERSRVANPGRSASIL